MKGRSLRNHKYKRVYIVTTLFVLVVLLGLTLPRAFQLVGGLLLVPVHTTNAWLENSEHFIPTLLRDRLATQAEIERLENELIVAQSAALTFQRLEDENTRLRRLLNVEDSERIAAGVIARPAHLPYDLILLDTGSRSGITVGAPVYVGTDNVIGIVASVQPDYSFAQLFTAPGVELTGYIAGSDVVATLEGIGNGVARMRVPQGVPLTVGDLVYTPGINPGLFGKIDYIENRPSQPEQYGYISLPVSLQSLHFVAVGTAPITAATGQTIEDRVTELIAERLLREEAHTVSFEELLATSTPTTSPTTSPIIETEL